MYQICIWIFLELRQRGRFAGFSLYISNSNDRKHSDLCYTDGPQLPPLNFTTLCIGYGRYVIFYNERLRGVSYPSDYQHTSIYTELCEVIVQGNARPQFQIFNFLSKKWITFNGTLCLLWSLVIVWNYSLHEDN